MRFTRRLLLGSIASLALAATCCEAGAQAFPVHPIRLVIPQGPGSSADLVGRMLADFMTKDLKQPVVAENQRGANGIVASKLVLKESPDGYTLLLTSVSLVSFNPFLYKKIPYDPLTDFSFVAPVADAGFVLVASKASGIKSWDGLMKRAKADPGGVSFASAGLGNSTHLYTEMISLRSGFKLRHFTYQSSGLALNAVVAGQADVMTVTTATALPKIKSGKVVGLAQSGDTPSPQLPDLPLLRQLRPEVPSLPGWFALVGPAKMDPKVTRTLAASVTRFLSDPAIKQQLINQFLFPIPGTPADLRKRAENDARIWGGLIRTLGIQID